LSYVRHHIPPQDFEDHQTEPLLLDARRQRLEKEDVPAVSKTNNINAPAEQLSLADTGGDWRLPSLYHDRDGRQK